MRIGPGMDPTSEMGPVVSAGQLERIKHYVAIGQDEGAELVLGGEQVGDQGYFHEPTVFTGVRNDMRIAQEEIFGPVMGILPFRSEEEAYAIANDVSFGLAAGVWTNDLSRPTAPPGAAGRDRLDQHLPDGLPERAVRRRQDVRPRPDARRRVRRGDDARQERVDEGRSVMPAAWRSRPTSSSSAAAAPAASSPPGSARIPATQVVLLEAGPDWRSADAPVEVRSMNGWRALDEAACAQFQWTGLESRRSAAQEPRAHVRGRGLGGSSVVNGMIAIHAMADDYHRWAADGCPGWSFEDILPYRRRLESDLNFGDRPYHGAAGPIPVQRLDRDEWGPADEALAESAAAEGHVWCEDHNAPAGTGVSPYGISARDGARVTTNDGYLDPARERENLRVLGGATVDQVLLEANQATGVRARVGDEWVEIRADKVVLCAGAIGSPAILLRYGHRAEGSAVRLPSASTCRSTRWRCSAALSTAPKRTRDSTLGRPTAACATPPDSRAPASTT